MRLLLAALCVCISAVHVLGGGVIGLNDGSAAAPGCRPADITDSDDAGCGRWFPRFHPKNAAPLAHNNDANAPFFYKGVYHIFMQANFPGVAGWNATTPAICCL